MRYDELDVYTCMFIYYIIVLYISSDNFSFLINRILILQVGPSGCGKSNVVRLLATLTGQKLRSIAMNSAMDTTEILGGFEQVSDNVRQIIKYIFLTMCLQYLEK